MSELLVGSIDQGTSSTRFIVFDLAKSAVVASHQLALDVDYGLANSGKAEIDPLLILSSVYTCMDVVSQQLLEKGYQPSDVQAVGVTNQRESTVVWDKTTGQPLFRAILWLDTRTNDVVNKLIQTTPTKSKEYYRDRSGLPIQSYFSGAKLTWLIENVPAVRAAIEENRCLVGTIDSWIIWNLTGGVTDGKHVTDVSNASRTMLMNIETLQWDHELCRFYGVPQNILPTICSSAEVYGLISSTPLRGVPLSGCLGDQQSALVGQQCFKIGQAKNTYGTGCFLIYNTGDKIIHSHSLLTTVAYKFGSQHAVYALEGSIAIAGAAVTWLKHIGLIENSDQMSTLSKIVADTNGVYFVPAFSGLYAPHWRPDAGGIIVGITSATSKNHIVRATLEAVCFQTRDIIDVMAKECRYPLVSLRVDGGMTKNDILMQTQADFLGIQVVRPFMAETTALGAAIAAAIGVGKWDITKNTFQLQTDIFNAKIDSNARDVRFARWHQALKRSFLWNTDAANQESIDDFEKTILESTQSSTPKLPSSAVSVAKFITIFGIGAVVGGLVAKSLK